MSKWSATDQCLFSGEGIREQIKTFNFSSIEFCLLLFIRQRWGRFSQKSEMKWWFIKLPGSCHIRNYYICYILFSFGFADFSFIIVLLYFFLSKESIFCVIVLHHSLNIYLPLALFPLPPLLQTGNRKFKNRAVNYGHFHRSRAQKGSGGDVT